MQRVTNLVFVIDDYIKEESVEHSVATEEEKNQHLTNIDEHANVEDDDDDDDVQNEAETNEFGPPPQSFSETMDQDNKKSHTVFYAAGQVLSEEDEYGRQSQG